MGNSMKVIRAVDQYSDRCALVVVCLSALQSVAQERSYINPSTPGGSGSPFSGALLTTLYISGMLGLENGEVPAEPADEAPVLDAIKGTLEEAGMTMDDLVYVQIFCSDVSHYGSFNEVYRTYFTQEPLPGPLSVPARCCSMPDLRFRRSR